MSISEKLREVIKSLEDSVSYEDWSIVEDNIKELTFIHEELEADFPLDMFDDEY